MSVIDQLAKDFWMFGRCFYIERHLSNADLLDANLADLKSEFEVLRVDPRKVDGSGALKAGCDAP